MRESAVGATFEARGSYLVRASKRLAALVLTHAVALGPAAITTDEQELIPTALPAIHTIETDVIIQRPPDSSVTITEAQVRNELQRADQLLTFSTHGAATFEDEMNTTVRYDRPHGDAFPDPDIYQPCYTEEQINGIHDSHRLQHGLGESVFTLLVLDDIKSCQEYGALADWNRNISTYNHISAGTILHEFGHSPIAGNNKHAAWFTCPEKTSDGGHSAQELPIRYSTASIKEKIEAGCGPIRVEQDKVDIYSAYETVMGSKSGHVNRDIYMPTELARMAPERFTIQQVGPVSGRHYLGLGPDDTLGVKLFITPDHPLKDIDPTIASITFGLQSTDTYDMGHMVHDVDTEQTVLAIAEGAWQSYVLDTEVFTRLKSPRICDPYYERLDPNDDYMDEPIIYSDKTMGTVVSIGRDHENGDQPYVQFDTYASTADKRSRLQVDLDDRRYRIFGEQGNITPPAVLRMSAE